MKRALTLFAAACAATGTGLKYGPVLPQALESRGELPGNTTYPCTESNNTPILDINTTAQNSTNVSSRRRMRPHNTHNADLLVVPIQMFAIVFAIAISSQLMAAGTQGLLFLRTLAFGPTEDRNHDVVVNRKRYRTEDRNHDVVVNRKRCR